MLLKTERCSIELPAALSCMGLRSEQSYPPFILNLLVGILAVDIARRQSSMGACYAAPDFYDMIKGILNVVHIIFP